MANHRRLFRLRTKGGGEAERELREEIEAHIEMRIEDQVRRGAPESDAREEALRRFGDPEAAWTVLRASVLHRERRLRLREWLDAGRRSLLLTARQVPFLANSMTLMTYAPAVPEEEMAVRMARPLAEVNPDIAFELATFESRVGAWVQERRFVMRALTGFAGLALALAAIGIYGLLSFTVAQRTREMGIRTALGAQRSGIIGLMMVRASQIFLAGAAVGVLAAYWLTRAMAALLVDIAPTDPLTYVAALAVLGLGCAAAAFVPAWRASRTDPLIALRTG